MSRPYGVARTYLVDGRLVDRRRRRLAYRRLGAVLRVLCWVVLSFLG